MKKATITIHYDAGHAWGSATRRELIKLGIEGLISAYSHQSGGHIYLEEDGDLAIYCHARGLEPGEIDWIEIDDGDHSPIRNLPPFRPKSCDPVSREEWIDHQRKIAGRPKTNTDAEVAHAIRLAGAGS